MPKVFTHDAKGLVQKAGTGIDVDNLGSGLRLKHADSGAAITLKAKTTTVTLPDGAGTTTDTANGFVPAGSKIVAAGLEVVTASAGGNTFNITGLGLDGDPDFFFSGATISANAVGGMKIGAPSDAAAVAATFATTDDRIRVTHGGAGGQTTDGVVRLTLWYYDLSATAAVSNN